MRFKYFNTVNALAPPPDLYVILHFIQLTVVDKYDARQQLHKCSYALTFKILVQKMHQCKCTNSCMSFCLIFISYDITWSVRAISQECCLCPKKSANEILYNCSVNKLILCYILNKILCFCSILPMKMLSIKPQQNFTSVSNTVSQVSWKCILVVRHIKMKTPGIDMQKWTLAYIWFERVWHAYNTTFLGMNMIHSLHIWYASTPNPNPTHRVAYSLQSPFLRINTTSLHFYLAYY